MVWIGVDECGSGPALGLLCFASAGSLLSCNIATSIAYKPAPLPPRLSKPSPPQQSLAPTPLPSLCPIPYLHHLRMPRLPAAHVVIGRVVQLAIAVANLRAEGGGTTCLSEPPCTYI